MCSIARLIKFVKRAESPPLKNYQKSTKFEKMTSCKKTEIETAIP